MHAGSAPIASDNTKRPRRKLAYALAERAQCPVPTRVSHRALSLPQPIAAIGGGVRNSTSDWASRRVLTKNIYALQFLRAAWNFLSRTLRDVSNRR